MKYQFLVLLFFAKLSLVAMEPLEPVEKIPGEDKEKAPISDLKILVKNIHNASNRALSLRFKTGEGPHSKSDVTFMPNETKILNMPLWCHCAQLPLWYEFALYFRSEGSWFNNISAVHSQLKNNELRLKIRWAYEIFEDFAKYKNYKISLPEQNVLEINIEHDGKKPQLSYSVTTLNAVETISAVEVEEKCTII